MDIASIAAWVARKGKQSIFPYRIRQVDRFILCNLDFGIVVGQIDMVVEAFHAGAAFQAESGLQPTADEELAAVTLDVKIIFQRGDGLDGVFGVEVKEGWQFLPGDVLATIWQGAKVNEKGTVHGELGEKSGLL
jgi:hypothetical protein